MAECVDTPAKLFFSIAHTFCSADSDEIISDQLQELKDAQDAELGNKFLDYWTKECGEIWNARWVEKYPDHCIEAIDEEEVTATSQESDQQDKQTNGISEATQVSQTDWNILWEAHRYATYVEYYYKYQNIYQNFYLPQLEENFTTKPEQIYAEEDSESADIFESDIETAASDPVEYLVPTAELKALKLANLPIAFGRKHIKYAEQANDDDDESETMDESGANSHKLRKRNKIKKKKLKRNTQLPEAIKGDKSLKKYYANRFSLFSRFDEGIELDREGWYSVTPEKIAKHMAQRFACGVVVDGFCGCGGNAIQFAQTCDKVIAIDIDETRLAMAKHNATVYGVEHKIEFILGDFFALCGSGKLQADFVFLSPPWGGPAYKEKANYDIELYLEPEGASELMATARSITENIALYLPRNSIIQQVIRLAGNGNKCEIEHNYLDTRLVGLTAIYGDRFINNK